MRPFICISALALLTLGMTQGTGPKQKDFQTKRVQHAPVVKKMTSAQLIAQISKHLGKQFGKMPKKNPQLCARTPWIDLGNIDVFMPGRWDTESNSVFFSAIRSTGSSPGEWEGTVGYVKFKPPTTGDYLIMTHFTGFKMACEVKGPWGTASNTTQTTSDDGLVITTYHAANTNPLNFTFTFKSPSGQGLIGYWYGTEFIKM